MSEDLMRTSKRWPLGKRNHGILFDRYGKCPKCGSCASGLKSTLEEENLTGLHYYECLMCGTQWQEFCIDDLDEKKVESSK